MNNVYLDTSAAVKLLVEERESEALTTWMGAALESDVTVVSSLLLETELRRFAQRVRLGQTAVTTLLETIDLAEMPPSLFHEAGILPGAGLRSPDALHLASAARIGVSGVLTYDERMADAAYQLGIPVHRPTPPTF